MHSAPAILHGIPGAEEGENSEYGTVYITETRPEFSTCFFVLAFQLPLPYTEPMSKPYKPADKPELMELIEKNVPLGDIDTSLITDMSYLFNYSERKDFSGIEEWDTSRVTNMVEMFAVIDTFPGGGRQAFNQPLTGWKLRTQDTYHMFYYSCYSHLETLIMAAASFGSDDTPAGYRARVKEQLKNLCGRFGKETIRNALIEYKDKYATGTLLNALEEMG